LGTDTIIKTKPIVEVREPPLFKIIYVNDEQTTMEFVISTLIEIFNYNEDRAIEITHKIHEDGSAVVAVLPFEIAEQKGIEVSIMAKRNGFPLVVKLEADQ
jgi:ATP-dependent Clp protease adaptor protein ClpS